jgi:3-hydroxyisobutyrate dehydrogenase-like beta-hydroxyacid dehydrogenase
MSQNRSVASAGLGHMGDRFERRLIDAGWNATVLNRERQAANAVLLSVVDDHAVARQALAGRG